MCGVVGIVANQFVNQELFDALTVLQHRGQDAAGIVTCDGQSFSIRKGNGLVRDIFRTRHMKRLSGNIGIGHVRYPTAGSSSELEAQPFYVNSPFGIALAHNGNLTNARALKKELFDDDLRHINTGSDSEVILNIFAHELQTVCKAKLTNEAIFHAIKRVHERCRGGYAVVGVIAGHGIVAFRDPHGIRPLVFGKRSNNVMHEAMVASESAALTALGFQVVDDVQPGEGIFINTSGEVFRSSQSLFENFSDKARSVSPCLFEYVYFARPDSIIDKISVYKLRKNLGNYLAEKIKTDWPDHDIDVVIPIPETSRNAAIPLANNLGVEIREGFVKNRYIGRTFIMPGQTSRQRAVHRKLSVIELEFKNKNVLLVDDSIVRGTTSKEIINMARRAGANKVYFASSSPPIRFPNIYGIDMPNKEELIAHNRSINEIEELIGADKLIYLDLNDLIEAAREGNRSIHKFDSAVFDGIYVTGDETEYLSYVANSRRDQSSEEISEQSPSMNEI
tara:strand:- start:4269 stop:5786 length:1518 start_codon:yes stop_codon:yes gene_type:complete